MLATVLAVIAAAAAPHSQTATLGAVTATATWKGEAPLVTDFRIAVDRNGQRVLDEPVQAMRCAGCDRPMDLEPLSPSDAVQVVDFDADGEPEVLAEAYSGGAHCCLWTVLWRYNGGQYTRLEHDFGNLDAGFEIADLDHDGTQEFRAADDWSYAFGAYVESVSPIQILALQGARLADVTTRFRPLVRAEARRYGREYRRLARHRRRNVRPILAAYVADLHRLGQHHHARAELTKARERGLLKRHSKYELGPFGGKYLRELRKLLREGGYLSP